MTNDEILNDIKSYRKNVLGETQTVFWKRFGLTQPGGSLYEKGLKIPAPTALLIILFANEYVSPGELDTLLSTIRNNKNISIAD